MGYLLTKQADMVQDKTPLGIPYMKPNDSETAGNILGGLVAGGGLAGTGVIGNSLFKKKLLNDKVYNRAVMKDMLKIMQNLHKSDNAASKWLRENMFKSIQGSYSKNPTLLGKGTMLATGFKNLKLPGKLKALGLVAAPFAAGGLIDAAVD